MSSNATAQSPSILKKSLQGDFGSEFVGYKRKEASAVKISLQSVLDGFLSVETFGAVGDGITDCSASVQAAINESKNGIIYFPEGEYLFKSPIICGKGVTLRGAAAPGSSINLEQVKTTSFLVKDFSGDFITFNGSSVMGTVTGSGGGIEKLSILNKSGVSGSSNGRAIVVTGINTTNRSTWVRICEIEVNKYSPSYADFEWGIDIDGSFVTGALGGVRDIFISKSRFVSDVGAAGSIRVFEAFNLFIDSVSCNLSKGKILISGSTASNQSSGVRVANSYGSLIHCDYGNNVVVIGGNFTNCTATSNAGPDIFYNSGKHGITDNNAIHQTVTNSRITKINDNANTEVTARDLNAGDSQNTVQKTIGNANIAQGGTVVSYKNDTPASGAQEGALTLKGRNTADSGEANMASLKMIQVAGQNSAQVKIYTGSDRKILCYQQGNHNIQFKGSLLPDSDNTYNIGSSGGRWANIYAASGAVSTSDERLKTEILKVSEKEKKIAIKLKSAIGKYKFKDSKNKSPRIHFGIGAQTVKRIFEENGLNANDYGLFCYDEWGEEHVSHKAIYDEKAEHVIKEAWIEKIREKGDRYGIRYEELLCFIMASM